MYKFAKIDKQWVALVSSEQEIWSILKESTVQERRNTADELIKYAEHKDLLKLSSKAKMVILVAQKYQTGVIQAAGILL